MPGAFDELSFEAARDDRSEAGHMVIALGTPHHGTADEDEDEASDKDSNRRGRGRAPGPARGWLQKITRLQWMPAQCEWIGYVFGTAAAPWKQTAVVTDKNFDLLKHHFLVSRPSCGCASRSRVT